MTCTGGSGLAGAAQEDECAKHACPVNWSDVGAECTTAAQLDLACDKKCSHESVGLLACGSHLFLVCRGCPDTYEVIIYTEGGGYMDSGQQQQLHRVL